MTESLEEQGTALLEEFARSQGKKVRDLGVLNRRRQRQINKYEMPMSQVLRGTLPAVARDDMSDPEDE